MYDFLTKLASAPSSPGGADHINLLGKRAAGMFTRGEATNLTDAVTKVAMEEDGLSKDQIRRVAEVANQSTWQELFVHGGNRDASFQPADGDAVLSHVAPAPHDKPSAQALDFLSDPPPAERRDPSLSLEEAFGVKGLDEYPEMFPFREQESLHEKTAAVASHFAATADELHILSVQAAEELFSLVKQAHLQDGVGILQISRAMGMVTEPEFAQGFMKMASARLQREGVRMDPKGEMEKLAHVVVVNHEHPLMVTAARLEKLAEAHRKATAAAQLADTGTGKLRRFLRDKAREG